VRQEWAARRCGGIVRLFEPWFERGCIVIVVVGCRLSSPVFSFSFISNKKREFEIKSAVILNFNRNFEVEFVFEESESKIIFKINSGKKNRNLKSEIFLK